MNMNFKNFLVKSSIVVIGILSIISCSDDDVTPTVVTDDDVTSEDFVSETKYFAGIESSITGYTLSSTDSFESGQVSPIDNGFSQTAWASYIQGEDEIFSLAGVSLNSYNMSGTDMVEGETIFTELGIYASDVVDESTLVIMTSPWYGVETKTLHLINTDDMLITTSVDTNLGDDVSQTTDDTTNAITSSGLTMPSDIEVVGDKVFVSYYNIDTVQEEDESGAYGFPSPTTPNSNTARLAIYSYPDLEFEKIITDDRIANIGRYYTQHAMATDENGDLYVTAPSSLACGYYPVPENNSGILRVNNGETEFDIDYYIDFETLSGGYKINDIYYVGEGKAVVRILKEDETDLEANQNAYDPYSTNPLLNFGIIDLYNETFELVTGAPNGGGGWNSAVLVEDNTVYVGISNSTYSGVYVIDVETGIAIEGADIDGTYAQALLSLETTEE